MTKLNQKAAAPKVSTKASAKPAKTVAAPKAAPAKAARPDVIKEVKSAVGGDHVVVSAGAGQSEIIRHGAFKGQLTKLAVVGGSLKAVREFIKTHKPEAKLATGLNGKNAPQSAQAAADSRSVGKGLPVAGSAKTQTSAPAKTVAKASAGAKLPKKSGYADNAPIKATDKGSTKAAKLPASDKLNSMIKAGTVAKALALYGMSSGDLRYAEKTGLITVG